MLRWQRLLWVHSSQRVAAHNDRRSSRKGELNSHRGQASLWELFRRMGREAAFTDRHRQVCVNQLRGGEERRKQGSDECNSAIIMRVSWPLMWPFSQNNFCFSNISSLLSMSRLAVALHDWRPFLCNPWLLEIYKARVIACQNVWLVDLWLVISSTRNNLWCLR